MNALETQMHLLAQGHALLASCCAAYLAWWCVFFRPRASRPQGLEYGAGVALIVAAIVLGLLAVIRMGSALSTLPNAIPGGVLWTCAIVAYAVLAVVTSRLLERPITTELVLIVAWCTLEVSVGGAVLAAGRSGDAILLLVLTALACAGSLACYLAYYHLEGMAAFLDGCGPLVAIGILSVVVAVVI